MRTSHVERIQTIRRSGTKATPRFGQALSGYSSSGPDARGRVYFTMAALEVQ